MRNLKNESIDELYWHEYRVTALYRYDAKVFIVNKNEIDSISQS